MTSQKGPDLLVGAIPYVLSTHPNAKFIMAGEGDLRGMVEQRARDRLQHRGIAALRERVERRAQRIARARGTVSALSRRFGGVKFARAAQAAASTVDSKRARIARRS
jgi:glycosyltransferase involved in cell wall biosynthesis